MKSYREYSGHSVSMSEDAQFNQTLQTLFAENQIDYIIESGTYLGTGSTRSVLKAIPANRPPKAYYTLEANPTFHLISRFNLMRWPFVKPIWGNTIPREKALSFIEQDEVLRHHERYPDVFIDTLVNPVEFYTNEIKGHWNGNIILKTVGWLSDHLLTRPENLLEKLLREVIDQQPLILLDSAGGTGWLEYQTVRDVMGKKPYWLILDDIHHLKHFRSFADVQHRPDFRLVAHSLPDGWMVAEHLA